MQLHRSTPLITLLIRHHALTVASTWGVLELETAGVRRSLGNWQVIMLSLVYQMIAMAITTSKLGMLWYTHINIHIRTYIIHKYIYIYIYISYIYLIYILYIYLIYIYYIYILRIHQAPLTFSSHRPSRAKPPPQKPRALASTGLDRSLQHSVSKQNSQRSRLLV